MPHDHSAHEQPTRESIQQTIDQYGCYIAIIEANDYLSGFAYTIGLYQQFKHPEIICFGLKQEVMGSLLNDACALIREGQSLQTGKVYNDFLEDYTVQFLQVTSSYYSDYFGYGRWFYSGFDFPALQLLWPDKAHLYPWEEGFNPHWKFKQPLLDRNTDFKFFEEKNLGVYTTQQVLDGKPILYVFHNDDGDWQFHSESDPNLDEAKLVCLQEITKLDPSVNELHQLPYGASAWRESVEDQWHWEENIA